jgi:hypothetical protein
VNGRIKMPALIDDEIVVVNSPDIIAHLELLIQQDPSIPNRMLLAFTREAGNERPTPSLPPFWSISRIGNRLTDQTKCWKVCLSRLAPISGSRMTRSTANSLIGNL